MGLAALGLFTALGTAGLAFAVHAGKPRDLRAEVPIAVTCRDIPSLLPSEPSKTRFGTLDYLGGIELRSPEPAFGGFSGLRILGERLLAVSDAGAWLQARLVLADGRPVCLEAARMAPAMGPDGRPASSSRFYDLESLSVRDNVAFVGAERVHQILRFDLSAGLGAVPTRLPRPDAFRRLPSNRGLEAVGLAPATSPLRGALVAVAERSGDKESETTVGFILDGPLRGEFAVSRSGEHGGGYDVSDLDFLPNGDLVLLERSFSWLGGLGLRIRRIPAADIRPGAVLGGEVLLKLGWDHAIDNMEGLSVGVDETGATVFTLISDDNFSSFQRTVLLRFRLRQTPAPAAPALTPAAIR